MSSFAVNMVAIVVSLIAAGSTAATAYRATGRLRNAIKIDAEIFALLPDGPTKKGLMKHIDRQIGLLIEEETEKTRDLPMLIVAIVALAILSFATVQLVAHGSWWSYVAAVVTAAVSLLFFYGAIETSQKAKRDAKGVRVE